MNKARYRKPGYVRMCAYMFFSQEEDVEKYSKVFVNVGYPKE